jgi:glycosyltransferase involved in cell wall biosynthesis
MAARRILIVTASARRRGAEIQATQLSQHLTQAGRDSRVVALSTPAGLNPLPIEVLGRHRLTLTTLARLRRAARSADIVVAYGSTSLPACVIALVGTSIPFVYRGISDPARWTRGALHKWATAFQYRRPDHIAALWGDAGRSITEFFGVPPERVSVIPNARDEAYYRPPSTAERALARAEFSLQPATRAVVFIGSLSPEKRVDRAIETMAGLPEAVLLVAGDGPLREQAVRWAVQRHANVRFLGELKDVRPLLWAADAVVLPSDVEGMPGSALEALMCATPVVATAVGAIPELPGVRLAEPDRASLAQGVNTAFSAAPPDPLALGSYTWRTVTHRWCALLDSLVAKVPTR